MTTATPTPTVSKAALRTLTELTGEPRFNVALLIALGDAVEHRLEKIDAAIYEFEQKYGMPFEQFQTQGEQGKIPDQFSYEVESDYLEWDGVETLVGTNRLKPLFRLSVKTTLTDY